MKRVAILISGGGSNMLALLRDMASGPHPCVPVLVASNDPTAGGLAKAAALGIPTAAVDHRPFGRDRAGFEAALLQPILAAKPDILCLAGFMRILTPDFIRQFEGRMVNIHPSLLPSFRGVDAIGQDPVVSGARICNQRFFARRSGRAAGLVPSFSRRMPHRFEPRRAGPRYRRPRT